MASLVIDDTPARRQISTDVELAIHLHDVLGLDLRPSEVKALRELLQPARPANSCVSPAVAQYLVWISNMAFNLKQGPLQSNLSMEEEWGRVHLWVSVICRELGVSL